MARVLVLLALVATVAAVRAPAARADDGPDCLPAGGADRPFEALDVDPEAYDVLVNGGGFGHGVGMSQYGAQGAAKAGCSYQTILGTYYPGTTVGPAPTERPAIAVHLRRSGPDVTTVRTSSESAGGRPLAWVACDESGTECPQVAEQPPGTDWRVYANADGTFTLADPDVPATCVTGDPGCHWHGGSIQTRLRLLHDGVVVRLVEVETQCRGTAGICVKWGFTEFDYTTATAPGYPQGSTYITEYVTGSADGSVTATQRYLLGLSEVPLSWEPAALQAQTVAAASYAEATIRGREAAYGRHEVAGYVNRPDGKCRCDLFRTTVDQHWTGWEHERVDEQYAAQQELDRPKWAAAVEATEGQFVLYEDEPIPAFYSSSHGGFSENVEDVWAGSPVSYLRAVDTSRWECLSGNPLQRWSKGFTRAQLAAAFGLQTLDELEVLERGPGGRPTALDVDEDHIAPDGVVARGTDGSGQPTERRYSGESIRSKLGLRSGLVHVQWVQPDTTARTTSEASSGDCTSSQLPPRVWGEDRTATSTEAAELGWEQADTVVLARADHPADALAGSGLAGALGAPLLVNPSDHLDEGVAATLDRLGATSAVLLGGPAALSEEVQTALEDRGLTTERVQGDDRFATAAAIAERLAPEPEGDALIVRGYYAGAPEREWPDALAVAALAARRAAAGQAWPVLLTSDTVPQATLDALQARGTTRVHLVGGEAIIPPSVEQQLTEAGYTVDRIAGEDRWATSREVLALDEAEQHLLVLATGTNFPDGLSAGPLAAQLGGRLLLVPTTYQADASPWQDGQHPDAVRALGWDDGQVLVVGGEVAITDPVAQAIRDALAGG